MEIATTARTATMVDTTLARTIDSTRRRLAGLATGSPSAGLGQPGTAAWARLTGMLRSLGEAACALGWLALGGTAIWAAPRCAGLAGTAAAASAETNAGAFAGLPQTSQ